MAVDLRRVKLAEETAQQASDVTGRTEQELLDRVVAAVRDDSRRNSDRYLGETTVPHGGE